MTHARLATMCLVLFLGAGDLGTAAAKGTTVVLQSPEQRKLAPDFVLKDAAGKAVRLSDHRGRVVLLDFWATKCGGCVEEIPWFIDISRKAATTRLVTIGVSEDIVYEDLKGPDEAWALVRPFVREHKVPYTILMGDGQVTAQYDIKALPLTYLIDRQGRVAAVYAGLVDRADLEANIRRLL